MLKKARETRRRKEQTRQGDGQYTITFKGVAMEMAINTGLVKYSRLRHGYKIGAFLRFWNGLSFLVKDALDDGQDIREMFNEQCHDGADDD